jgi:hypothetical protein
MGFSNQERINLNSKVIAAGVKDANEIAQWYESVLLNRFISNANTVWRDPDLSTLLNNPAANLTEAQSNADGYLTSIVENYSEAANAIRLTVIPGTNDSTYVALETYDDLSSTQLINWIQPQFVPRSNGLPSGGYSIRLFDGDPNSGGVEVLPTDGTTGSGVNKSVGWIFDYASGVLLLSSDFRSSVSDPYILGFRYIGTTANTVSDGYVPIQESLVVTIPNQTEFILTNQAQFLVLFIDGIKQEISDYDVDGYTLTWNGSIPLSPGDIVETFYYVSIPSGGGISIINPLDKKLALNQTLDPPPVAAGGEQELTVTVIGAEPGDQCSVTPVDGVIDSGIILQARVTSLNIVTVRWTNITASSFSIDPASRDYNVFVWKH